MPLTMWSAEWASHRKKARVLIVLVPYSSPPLLSPSDFVMSKKTVRSLRTGCLTSCFRQVVKAVFSSLPPSLAGRWGAPAWAPEGIPQPTDFSSWLPTTRAEWQVCLGSFGFQLAVSDVVT